MAWHSIGRGRHGAAGLSNIWIQGFGEKSVISLTKWLNTQGDSAMDGGIRNLRHGRRQVPTRTV